MSTMYLSMITTLLLTSITSASSLDALLPGQSTNSTSAEAYLQEVCYPPSTDPIPPCQSILNIETQCEPNGTSPLALDAHAQCMCTGSFFSDWEGCLACNSVHGGRSPQVAEAFLTLISSVSNILCTGTSTAKFAAIFSGLSVSNGVAEGGNTFVTDRYPSQTAISLYYTDTRSQGPGTITGSATAATATVSTTEKYSTTSTGGQTSSSGSRVMGGNTASSSSSAGGAAQTGAWMEVLGMVAGGVLMAVL